MHETVGDFIRKNERKEEPNKIFKEKEIMEYK